MDTTTQSCACGCRQKSGNTAFGAILGAVAAGAIVLAGAAGYAYGQDSMSQRERPAAAQERPAPSAGQHGRMDSQRWPGIDQHEVTMFELREMLQLLALMQQMQSQPMPAPPIGPPAGMPPQMVDPSMQQDPSMPQDPSAMEPGMPGPGMQEEPWAAPRQPESPSGGGEQRCVTTPSQGGVTTWCVGGGYSPQSTPGIPIPGQPGQQDMAQGRQGPWPGFVPRPT